MEENGISEQKETKQFSLTFLEKLRQFKKDKEIPEESKPAICPSTPTQTEGTEFASAITSNGEFSRGGGRGGRGGKND